jgi:uncharacterized membrane protein YfcA
MDSFTLGLPHELLLWHVALLFASSFFIGLLGGLIGLALGTLRLPLMLLLGIPAPAAAGTNILISSVAAIVGSYRHLRDGRVQARIVMVVGLPTFAGAFIGGLFSSRAPENLLIGLIGGLLLWQGISMALLARRQSKSAAERRRGADEPDSSGGAYPAARFVATGGAGLGIGLLGGAVGLLLGSVRLPLMVRILRADPRVAAGSNMLIGMVMGALGWVGHLLYGQFDWKLLLILGPTAIVGSYLGARLTGRIDRNLLILVMGAALTGSGIMLLWRSLSVLL